VSVLDRKLRRELGRVRTTLVAILLVVVMGVACFVGLISVYLNLESSRRAYYGQCRMADFWVSLKKAPLAEAERLTDVPGVAEIRPRIVFQATVDLEDVARPLMGQVITLPAAGRSGINDIVLQRGSHFTDERLEQVIVNESFARARNIDPGQTIHVILNNRRQALYVVGTALSSEFVYLISPGGLTPDFENYGVFYVKQRFAEEVLDFDGACNEIVGLLTPDARANPAPVLDVIEKILEPYGVFTSTPRSEQASHQILTGELAQLRASAVITPAIFLAVAALVLNILMFRLAEQQRVTIGTLKALGYSNARLLRHYLGYGLVVGIAGGLLGALTGYGLAQGMIVQYRVYFEFPRLDNEFIPWVYGVAVLVSVAFSLLGTVRGVRSVIRLDPAEAMRARPPVTAGAVWMERFRRVWSRLGFRWQMVMRSVWRHKWRTAAGVFAALMGSAIMFVTFYFMDSTFYLLEGPAERLRADVPRRPRRRGAAGIAEDARGRPRRAAAVRCLRVRQRPPHEALRHHRRHGRRDPDEPPDRGRHVRTGSGHGAAHESPAGRTARARPRRQRHGRAYQGAAGTEACHRRAHRGRIPGHGHLRRLRVAQPARGRGGGGLVRPARDAVRSRPQARPLP
jgi:putative ABC transport system permease protein